MDAKLTLSVDEKVVDKAKEYAKKRKVSLSVLIENFLIALTAKDITKEEISPLVRDLSGVIELPEGFDYRKERAKNLEAKYK